jgi:ATP-dependent RNA helicase DHX37/DHR1
MSEPDRMLILQKCPYCLVVAEDATFEKVCKIHRKLPQGGILVFLTGKAEIVRMVNRLRRSLSQKKSTGSPFVGTRDVATSRTDITYSSEGGFRDMDDDEVDGDMFQAKHENDYNDNEDEQEEIVPTPKESEGTEEGDDNIPKDVIVLPLYSMLSAEEQAKVFASVPDGHRLIVVSTNIAETSITIPSISYVVDTGREKCKNYDVKTGVASFDISWISKAAANQRAGRAGRTGPGHCYRLYSSSMFSRHMDDFALPEVLTRPLEDVILAMKAMKISSVSKFPFPTPPAENQVKAAVKLLTNLGCVDPNDGRDPDSDGQVTHLGAAIATLPLGVRCGKMLLVAAHAGVLDYAIVAIAALSEKNPFLRGGDLDNNEKMESKEEDAVSSDDDSVPKQDEKKTTLQWTHKAGDVYAVMLAVGAYTYAGQGAGGISEKVACKQFCQDNGLNHVIMERIQKIRVHLSRLVQARMTGASGVAAETGKIPHSMKPPNKLQERLLLQVIASSFLDNVAMLAPLGSIPGSHPFSLRSAFLSSSSSIKEPLFMDRNSVLYSRDSRRLPQWVCYDYLVRKNLKDGTPIATMKNVTPVDPSWLGSIAKGSDLLSIGGPVPSPRPTYDADRDEIVCSVETKFGTHKWEIPSIKLPMYEALRVPEGKSSMHFHLDDPYRYFARFLLEGKVLKDLEGLGSLLNDSPSIMTSKAPVGKVGLLVSALSNAEVDSAAKLRRHWAKVDNKFLFKTLKKWVKPEHVPRAKKLWIDTVTKETMQ